MVVYIQMFLKQKNVQSRMLGTSYLARRLRATPFVHPNPSCDEKEEWYLPPKDHYCCKLSAHLNIILATASTTSTITSNITSTTIETTTTIAHLDIILATASRPTSSSAVVLLVDVP